MGKKVSRLKQAVIFAGGRGERLRPLTDKIPKPLVPVNDRPFLDYLLNSLFQVGIKHILLLIGYRGEIIQSRYGKRLDGDIEIMYSPGEVHYQTGRRLLNAYGLLDECFMLLYGDNYWPIELPNMLRLYKEKNAHALTTVFSNRNGTGEYGRENNIEVGSDNFVKKYDKKKKADNLNGVDIGYFILQKNIIPKELPGNISFEEDILPSLVSKRQLIGYLTDSQYYYITDLKSLNNFESVVRKKGFRPFPENFLTKG